MLLFLLLLVALVTASRLKDTGETKFLVFVFTASDQASTPDVLSDNDYNDAFRFVSDYYWTQSGHTQSLTFTRLRHTTSLYTSSICDRSAYLPNHVGVVNELTTQHSAIMANFNRFMVVFMNACGVLPFAGMGIVNDVWTFVIDFTEFILIHEIGHTNNANHLSTGFNLNEANNQGSLSPMGYQAHNFATMHFMIGEKDNFGWLPDGTVVQAQLGHDYVITAHDTGGVYSSSNVYGLYWPGKYGDANVMFEYRSLRGVYASMSGFYDSYDRGVQAHVNITINWSGDETPLNPTFSTAASIPTEVDTQFFVTVLSTTSTSATVRVSSTAPAPTTTTPKPTTASPVTSKPTTKTPTTASPTTAKPTTKTPTASSPTTASPVTPKPTTASPTTKTPTASSPTTASPVTAKPTTKTPTTASPKPTTASPTTPKPTTASPKPTSKAPTTATLRTNRVVFQVKYTPQQMALTVATLTGALLLVVLMCLW